jgi:hypothetical protein
VSGGTGKSIQSSLASTSELSIFTDLLGADLRIVATPPCYVFVQQPYPPGAFFTVVR